MFFSSWQFNHWNEEFSISHKISSVGAFEPDFVIPLENVTVAQGRDATFTCVVNNLGGHRVSGDGASTPAKVCIGFQSHAFRFATHTTKRKKENTRRKARVWFDLLIGYRLSFDYFHLYHFRFSFQSVLTPSQVHYFEYFRFTDNEIKLHHKNTKKKILNKIQTIHSSLLLCNP